MSIVRKAVVVLTHANGMLYGREGEEKTGGSNKWQCVRRTNLCPPKPDGHSLPTIHYFPYSDTCMISGDCFLIQNVIILKSKQCDS
jgi:hypothetical protein